MLKASEMRKMFYNSVDKSKMEKVIKNALVDLERNAKEGNNYTIIYVDTKAEVNYLNNELKPLLYYTEETDGFNNSHTVVIGFQV